jgi:hypothetical protein
VPNKYAFVDDLGNGSKPYNTEGNEIIQCSAEVDHGHVLQVLQTNAYESCLFVTQSADSRKISAMGLTKPIIAQYWISNTKVLILTYNDSD